MSAPPLPTDLADETITGADWSALLVERVHWQRVTLVDVDLTEAQIRSSTFEECTLRRVRLSSTRHLNSQYAGCRFVDCEMFAAVFEDCKLTGSSFVGSRLRAVRATGGAWDFVTMPRQDLQDVQLRNLRMAESDLREIKARGIVLRDCDLSRAVLDGADLRDADLRGSVLASVDPQSVRLDGAQVTATQALTLAQNLGLQIRVE